MSDEKTEKSIAFNIVFDKERSRVLHVMMAATTNQLLIIKRGCPDLDFEAMIELFKEISIKIHKNDWCPDPRGCHHKSKP